MLFKKHITHLQLVSYSDWERRREAREECEGG